ncbi:esterase-like activity of phytase family protein [Limibaculum sp. M0105]|uniref:Esterase-like activity of phytase family protein n=1 Tax=Thermohalobaculum xanthum TaxID=2753746 RepID=A0A8J7SFB4_9RHOB|nr:esterase-like activity of phytase family protein [Thermohalobaculum xanthum]MBK0401162.1 esterase-like activity of phytase family protein [Thermohalobaculum xanthum]
MTSWRMRAACLVLALVLLTIPGPGRSGGPRAVEIHAEPTSVVADRLDGLVLSGAWELTGNLRRFGGFSGLIVDDGSLIAVSDRGVMVTARFARSGSDLSFSDGRLVRLKESDGTDPGNEGGDAEALTRLDGQIYAAFERDHRIAPLTPDGVMGAPITVPDFERLPSNGGIEALAATSGVLLAMPEVSRGGRTPLYVLDPGGRFIARGAIDTPRPHVVTDAAVGPDGMLYVTLRDFSLFTGFSIRVRRHRLAGTPPLPVDGAGDTLASFGAGTGIDNIEAVALWTDGEGVLRLWLLSDDNFNIFQRTLLLEFVVTR